MARPSFVNFVLIGGLASGVNLLARIAISQVACFELAIVGAFAVALLTAFELNRHLVFRSAGQPWSGQFLRFLLVNLAALVQIFAVTELFARIVLPAAGMTFYPETVAHAIGLTTPLFTSFWLHRRFTFAARVSAAA